MSPAKIFTITFRKLDTKNSSFSNTVMTEKSNSNFKESHAIHLASILAKSLPES